MHQLGLRSGGIPVGKFLHLKVEMKKFFILLLLSLLVSLFAVKEAFMSPGTLTQLESTHVPSREEVRYYNRPYYRYSDQMGTLQITIVVLLAVIAVGAVIAATK
jgi:hypothetical protein